MKKLTLGTIVLVSLVLASAHAGSEHVWVRLVEDYRAASRLGDVETLRRLQTDDARIWFGERQGEGRKLNPRGKGPWGDWDHFFNASSETLDVQVVDDGVRLTQLEVNDWYRLVDRTPVPYYVFYFVDGDRRIAGKLIQSIPGVERKPDRLEQFRTWAKARYPDLLDRLMPAGEIDPALDNARLWKRHLIEWRAEAGLPDVPEIEP